MRQLEVSSDKNNKYYILIVALSEGTIQFWKVSSDLESSEKLEKELKVGSSTHVTCMTSMFYESDGEIEKKREVEDKVDAGKQKGRKRQKKRKA